MQADSAAPVMVTSDDCSAAVTPKDRDEMQVDDHTTASLAAPSVDDQGHADARTTGEIEDDDAATKLTETFDAAAVGSGDHIDGTEASVSLSIADAATKHAVNDVDAAAVNGNHAESLAQQEETSPSCNNIPVGDVDVVAAGELIEAPAPAGVAAEEGASPMVATDSAVDDTAAAEAVLGYTFVDKSLLEAALTHASFRGAGAVENYERLEFLGDRAISAAVARHLYRAHPGLGPGPLSRLHELNVGTEKLARAAVARGLHRFLRHEIEMPFFALRVGEFAAEAAAYPVHSNGQVVAPKPLADLVESLMGAVFLDSGSDHEQLWRAFLRLADPLIGPEMLPRLRQPRWELEKLCRGMGLSAPMIGKKDWARSHTVTVVVEGETVGSATYCKNHVAAQNRAILAAMDTIKARKASSTEALLKGERVAAGSTSLLQEEEAIAGLQVPITLGKRHGCCCDDVAASNKRFKLVGTMPSEDMAESESKHSKIDSEASRP